MICRCLKFVSLSYSFLLGEYARRIRSIAMVLTETVAGLNKGKAAIEFDTPAAASKAVKCMDGGQLDGSFLNVQVSLLIKPMHGLAIDEQR